MEVMWKMEVMNARPNFVFMLNQICFYAFGLSNDLHQLHPTHPSVACSMYFTSRVAIDVLQFEAIRL